MKVYFKLFSIALLLGVLVFSCDEDDDPVLKAPVISHFEFGEGNSHTSDRMAYKGSDIHLEAEIEAEAIVASISIDIHAHDLVPSGEEEEWDFERTYTDSKYKVRNPVFHEHFDIPSNIPAGEYHLLLTVTDELGNSTEVDGDIQILDPISFSDISIDTVAKKGEEFDAIFNITAKHGIHGVEVDIHAHGLTPGSGEVEWDFLKEFNEAYHGKTDVEFHEHIDVPATAPAGEYHVVFTVEDEEGNTQDLGTYINVTE